MPCVAPSLRQSTQRILRDGTAGMERASEEEHILPRRGSAIISGGIEPSTGSLTHGRTRKIANSVPHHSCTVAAHADAWMTPSRSMTCFPYWRPPQGGAARHQSWAKDGPLAVIPASFCLQRIPAAADCLHRSDQNSAIAPAVPSAARGDSLPQELEDECRTTDHQRPPQWTRQTQERGWPTGGLRASARRGTSATGAYRATPQRGRTPGVGIHAGRVRLEKFQLNACSKRLPAACTMHRLGQRQPIHQCRSACLQCEQSMRHHVECWPRDPLLVRPYPGCQASGQSYRIPIAQLVKATAHARFKGDHVHEQHFGFCRAGADFGHGERPPCLVGTLFAVAVKATRHESIDH